MSQLIKMIRTSAPYIYICRSRILIGHRAQKLHGVQRARTTRVALGANPNEPATPDWEALKNIQEWAVS